MKIWTISLNGDAGPVVTSIEALVDVVASEAVGLEPDDGFHLEITAGQMSVEDYNKMPEFGGW